MSFLELKEKVIDTDLCARCGACNGSCPVGCIEFRSNIDFSPTLNGGKCINCKRCTTICPGLGYEINRKIEGKKYDTIIGSYLSIYTGVSTSEEILSSCSSGGVITSLLVYLFSKNIITEAIVVSNTLNSEEGYASGIIARNVSDVIKASQSKYANVATLNLLKEAKKTNNKIAVVGVPCQIAALEKYCTIDNSFSNKVILKIGLFCGYTYTSDCFEYLFRYMGVEKQNVKAIKGWREDGVPGFFSVLLKNGDIKRISFQEEHALDTVFFSQNRCLLCKDCFSEYADLVVGDVGHFSYKDSLVIARTERGNNLLMDCCSSGDIKLIERSIEYALRRTVINFMHREKREKVEERIKLYSKDSRPFPSWNLPSSKKSIANKIIVKKQYKARQPQKRAFILENSKRHYKYGKYLYLGLENSFFIRLIRKIERILYRNEH